MTGYAEATLAGAAAPAAIGAAVTAQQARRTRCEAIVQGYQHDTATREQQQVYAQCLQRPPVPVLPVTDWVPPVLLTLFVALIALWIGVAFTAYRSLQRD
jgi:hypothetical protein